MLGLVRSWQMAEVQQGWGLAYRCKFLHLFFKEKLGSPNILKTVTVEWSKLLQHLGGLKKRPQKTQAKSSHSRDLQGWVGFLFGETVPLLLQMYQQQEGNRL